MKKIWKPLLYIVIVLGVLFAVLYPRLKEEPSKPGAAAKGGPPPAQKAPVTVLVLKSSSISNTIDVIGSLIPNEQVTLQPEISGKIEGIYFEEGSLVQKGQRLLSLQVNDLNAQLQKLKYNLQLSNTNESRQKQLLEREAISQQEYDQAVTSLQSLKADIANLNATIAKGTIYAPFSGQIGLRYVSNGAFITPQTKIAELVESNPIKLEFAIPGKYANEVAVGSEVTFTLEGDRTQQYKANVYALQSSIDVNTRTLTVRAKATNPGNKLKAGSFINVQLTIKKNAGAILVPTESVVPTPTGHMVYVKKNNLAQPVNITIGMRTAADVQVFEGLEVGDTLITTGTQFVKPGSELKILNVSVPIK